MPLSDWRDGTDHLDAHWGDVHNLDYLKANVAGGEGYAWYYASDTDRAAQTRTPIVDASEWQEHWIWRYKDLAGWWGNDHHDRVGGVRSAQPTAWVPRSKPFWFTEYGCAAIDRGTNQPNVFVDPKSSESALPYFSRGWRDDAIQMQYFRAMGDHWADPAHNPVSELYGGPMVDMSRAHAWAWDARPYPWFPGNRTLWSDGANWALGHWLTGRATGQPLDAVIAAICAQAGVPHVDVSRVHGVVRGFAAPSTDSARAMVQSLMLAYGVDAAERDGKLVFAMRHARPRATLTRDDLVQGQGGDLTLVRAPQADLTGRIRLGYVEEGADFDLRLAEAAFPDDSALRAAGSDLPLVMTAGEAQLTAQRWLAQSRVARDTARFALPPSSALGAGDVVALDSDDGPDAVSGLWRIDRATLSDAREVEATRVEPGLYGWGDTGRDGDMLTGFEAPAPVQALFLDLPLITGEEVPQAPWLAVTAQPWGGAVAVHLAGAGGAFQLDAMIGAPARVGITQTALFAAPAGVWDRGPALRVQMVSGELETLAPDDVLSGANLMAIGTGAEWEVFQFSEAELVAPDTYDLRLRLRGQQGTDGVMPQVWPAGAVVVMVDDRLAQLGLPLDALGLERTYRIGPASRPLTDSSHRDQSVVFAGVGLRPYRPAHLRAQVQAGGDVALSWVRRTRRGGDSWGVADVALSEVAERYAVRVVQGGQVLREQVVDSPAWSYALAAQQADGAGVSFGVEVAQLSDVVGPGPFARLDVTL